MTICIGSCEIIVNPETRDLLFVGWACRIFENFNGKGPDFKEMGVQVCFRFAVISHTGSYFQQNNLP